MRRRRYRPKRPRMLDTPEVLRILSRGGIWSAYRTRDVRTMRVGIVQDALAVWLVAEGRARHVAGVRDAAPRLAAPLPEARR